MTHVADDHKGKSLQCAMHEPLPELENPKELMLESDTIKLWLLKEGILFILIIKERVPDYGY